MMKNLTSYYLSGDVIRSRSVSEVVIVGKVDIPAPPARLIADWEREISQRLELEAGDVETLPFARARMRWPDYRNCLQAVSDWLQTVDLYNLLTDNNVALMACRGAKYHHDGEHYGRAAFCNLFLSEDKGLDLHFPSAGYRIPLVRGTVVVFDTGQPHAVIQRDRLRFNAADFPTNLDCSQVFLSWELPVENAYTAHKLQIKFDTDRSMAMVLKEEQVWLHGKRAKVIQDSGQWSITD